MLRDNSQLRISLSPYEKLYEIIIPKDHILRIIKENIDFSFVNPMLKKQYCEHFGRPAKEPEMMFKLLFLKKLYDLSDERLISAAQTDMAYKYFLGLDPEDNKTVNSTFYGYKNHLAMTEERIITAVKVTDGAQPDGNQLRELIDKTISNGVEVNEVIGDMAYVHLP